MKSLNELYYLIAIWAFASLVIFTIETTTLHAQIRDIQNEVTQIRRSLENAGR